MLDHVVACLAEAEVMLAEGSTRRSGLRAQKGRKSMPESTPITRQLAAIAERLATVEEELVRVRAAAGVSPSLWELDRWRGPPRAREQSVADSPLHRLA
jgi:hypothetical protein